MASTCFLKFDHVKLITVQFGAPFPHQRRRSDCFLDLRIRCPSVFGAKGMGVDAILARNLRRHSERDQLFGLIIQGPMWVQFGAICPACGVGAALALPYADADMMQLHLDEISRHVAEGAHAVLLLDRAGWHTIGKLDVPENITPIFLPSRAPELNPVENVWQYLRQNWLSNTVFENYDAIIDAACAAWRKLIALPDTITSIGTRDWASHRSADVTLGITGERGVAIDVRLRSASDALVPSSMPAPRDLPASAG
jgi:transposase